MKRTEGLKLNCCNEENKCEKCLPDFARRYYVEIDDEKEGDDKYYVFFPLLGFDDIMREHVEYFNPMVTSEGLWYLKQQDALALYKDTDKAEAIDRTIRAIIDHFESKSTIPAGE